MVLVKRKSFTAQSCNVKSERLSRDITVTQVTALFLLLFFKKSPVQELASGELDDEWGGGGWGGEVLSILFKTRCKYYLQSESKSATEFANSHF